MGEEIQPAIEKIRVLLADSRPMQSQLLADALRERGFVVSLCESHLGAMLQFLEQAPCDVLVMSSFEELAEVLRTVHLTKPQLAKIVLLNNDHRNAVVQAFRSGARGIFCLSESSFASFCECIQRVHRGEIWASSRQLGYLLDSVCQVPVLQVLTEAGESLLTSREQQVVALVADGLSNRNIANELGLSEHTVKKYLFRIFDKLGISNRVELVLYAVHHGTPFQPGFLASA